MSTITKEHHDVKLVNVHLDVLIAIVDAFERRPRDDQRVMGTLLGRHEAGIIEVSACFMVPHKESVDEVAVDKLVAHKMFELHKKAHPNDTIVGWYATGNAINEYSLLIHEYYIQVSSKHPMHLLVDPATKINKQLSIKTFTSVSMGVPNGISGHMFNPVPAKVVQSSGEKTLMEVFRPGLGLKENSVPVLNEIDYIFAACDRIIENIDQVIAYVNKVIESDGESGNSEIGRMLMDLVTSMPQMKPEQFKELINTSVKDQLMVIYLSKLISNQVLIQDKLISITLQSSVA